MLKKSIVFAILFTAFIANIKAQCPSGAGLAGEDITVCSGSNATLSGQLPTGFTGTWAEDAFFDFLQQGTITDKSDPNSTVTGLNTPDVISEIWTITDGAGCTGIKDTVTITIQTPPTSANGGTDKSVCLGEDSTKLGATAPPTGSVGMWTKITSSNAVISNPNDPKTSVTGLNQVGTDIFVWTVSKSECGIEFTDTITVTTSDIPSQAEAGADKIGCVGDTLTLYGSVATSGDPIWSRAGVTIGNTNNVRFVPNANNDTVKVALNVAGTYKMYYTVSVGPTNLNSPCTTRDSLTLTVNPALPVNAGADQISCDGSTTTFTVLGNKPAVGAGQWSLIGAPSGSVTTTDDTVGTVTGLSPGINTLVWEVTDGTCTANDMMTIAVGPPPTAEAGADLAGCVGDTLQLIGNNAGSYSPSWKLENGVSTFSDASFASNSNNDTVGLRLRGAGTYKIYYTIALGTSGDAAACYSRDSISVTSTGAPTNANISGSNTLTSCDTADTFTLSGNNPGAGEQGMWTTTAGVIDTSGSPTTAILSGLPQGITTVTWSIANAGGCISTDVATITIGADAGPDKVACVGDTAFVINGSSPFGGTALWSTQGSTLVSIVGSAAKQNVTLSINGVGTVDMLYTIIDGECVSTDTMTLTTDVTCIVTGIAEKTITETSSFSVYPNPTDGLATISLYDDEISAATLSLFSLDGRIVYSESLGTTQNIIHIVNLNNLTAGVYFVQLVKGSASYRTKLSVY